MCCQLDIHAVELLAEYGGQYSSPNSVARQLSVYMDHRFLHPTCMRAHSVQPRHLEHSSLACLIQLSLLRAGLEIGRGVGETAAGWDAILGFEATSPDIPYLLLYSEASLLHAAMALEHSGQPRQLLHNDAPALLHDTE